MNSFKMNYSETNKFCGRDVKMRHRLKAIGPEIHMLDHMITKNLACHVKAAGIDEITLMHGWIMRYLYENREHDIFQKDIEKTFSIGRSTVTSIIQLMEKKGYVRREFVEQDARLKKVTLTEKGIKNHESIEMMIKKLDAILEENIKEEELEIFFKVAGEIKKNLKKQKTECKKGGTECLEHC